ncbi:DUF4279 domain-containing protein [Paenibacillus sediminis]|uniref:DUF4279 domain-containing protein n=1 Tax=Paenibacillus sediminis TaxID=664909 RepID=A0ABS4GZB1_9BACL|nr:DUF4279 domain-containing protein [Paenibacillus sediminis]MBP1935595.1 hypothetical protein [Paenibacillus sediminis]
MEKTRVMVKLDIYGDNFNPQIITDQLNIQPHMSWQKGDSVEGKSTVRNKTCWRFSTGYQESLDINDQLSVIIERFQGESEKLIELIKAHNLEILVSIVINIEENQKPAMNFNKETISFIHQIGAEVDIDLYIYS